MVYIYIYTWHLRSAMSPCLQGRLSCCYLLRHLQSCDCVTQLAAACAPQLAAAQISQRPLVLHPAE